MTSARPDTRTHLVNTATSLFLTKSYGTISTSKICTAAEVNKGTFYHFFPSKAALLIAALDKYTAQTVAQIEQISGSSLPIEQKLQALFNATLQTNSQWQEESEVSINGCLISNIGHELSTVDEQIRAATQRCITALVDALKPAVEEFSINNSLNLPVQGAAEYLLAMMQGSLTMAKVFNSTEHLANMSNNAAACLTAMTQQDQHRAELTPAP